jgi:hypothetical protein
VFNSKPSHYVDLIEILTEPERRRHDSGLDAVKPRRRGRYPITTAEMAVLKRGC